MENAQLVCTFGVSATKLKLLVGENLAEEIGAMRESNPSAWSSVEAYIETALE